MSLAAFAHGAVLAGGLIVALGPQNVFVFQQGAVQPRLRRVLPTVVTAGVADTILVILAVLGVSVVVLRVPWLRTALFGAGFVFLAYVGWRLYDSPGFDAEPATGAPSPREQIGVAASVSLLNPHAIVDTVGVIGTNALAYAGPTRWRFAAGCLVVSWGWFGGLAAAGQAVGESAGADRWLRRLDAASPVVVWLAALYMGWQLVRTAGVP